MAMALKLYHGQAVDAAEAKSTAAIDSNSLRSSSQEEAMVSKGQPVNECAPCPLRDQRLEQAFGLPNLHDVLTVVEIANAS